MSSFETTNESLQSATIEINDPSSLGIEPQQEEFIEEDALRVSRLIAASNNQRLREEAYRDRSSSCVRIQMGHQTLIPRFPRHRSID